MFYIELTVELWLRTYFTCFALLFREFIAKKHIVNSSLRGYPNGK